MFLKSLIHSVQYIWPHAHNYINKLSIVYIIDFIIYYIILIIEPMSIAYTYYNHTVLYYIVYKIYMYETEKVNHSKIFLLLNNIKKKKTV